jgi:hypothetical protein
VTAEAKRELLSSTIKTLVIVIVLAFIGMLIFTFDPLLSLFVVLATVGVICTLAFFIICMMQWPVGPIEVIALIVFTGYTVTYSLHIAHKYGDSKTLELEIVPLAIKYTKLKTRQRYQRTSFAIKSIACAAMGSSITTIGCAVFLICCKLMIFKKLGSVVLAVTIMSIFTALAPLPAALLLLGPQKPGRMCFCWASATGAAAQQDEERPLSPQHPKHALHDSFLDHADALVPSSMSPSPSRQSDTTEDGVFLACSVKGQDARNRDARDGIGSEALRSPTVPGRSAATEAYF